MKADLYLQNGTVITETGVFHGGVIVVNDVITQVVADTPPVVAAETIDLQGKWLLPGLVDGHVHCNEPGLEEWERYRTATRVAAGGVTTILDMPLNSTPPTINLAELACKRTTVQNEAVVDYAHWGGLVDNNLAELAQLHDAGVIGLKVFMTYAPNFPRVNDDLIHADMERVQAIGNLIALHAENEYVTVYQARTLQAAGRCDLAAWPESRPPFQELEAIRRVLYWARVTGAHLHIVHVSIAEGVRAVAQAKLRGINVTVETCPQ